MTLDFECNLGFFYGIVIGVGIFGGFLFFVSF